ncbi:MAG: response regulator transcription factor [Lachnospiraceae bacterium]|nr:response regulator transcription factor [Lachnospiraceae bacterium]
MEKQTILIVEDDAAIREGVRILLEGEGYIVEEAENGQIGLERLNNRTDIVILDVMMPGMSGIKTCEEIRKVSSVPVLFLTAKVQESDKLVGLMAGGDDYLVKPFSYAELLGRIKALLRRRNVYDRQAEEAPPRFTRRQVGQPTELCFAQGCPQETTPDKEQWLEHSGIRINTRKNQAYCRGEEITLTDMEYRLLLLFLEYPQKVFSVENLYESVWGESFVYTSGNTVMVHIRRLRKKIEVDPQRPKLILTVWGKGYQFGE